MKTDKLEKFIADNRDEFDDLIPGPGVWDKIQKREPETDFAELDNHTGKGCSCGGYSGEFLHLYRLYGK